MQIYNYHGSEMGSVASSGTILNAYGAQMGSVTTSGTIYNAYGKEMGSVRGMVNSENAMRLAGGAALLLLLVPK